MGKTRHPLFSAGTRSTLGGWPAKVTAERTVRPWLVPGEESPDGASLGPPLNVGKRRKRLVGETEHAQSTAAFLTPQEALMAPTPSVEQVFLADP